MKRGGDNFLCVVCVCVCEEHHKPSSTEEEADDINNVYFAGRTVGYSLSFSGGWRGWCRRWKGGGR